MAVLLDTNILVRLAQPHHPSAQVAARALKTLRSGNETLHITQQNIVEFWAVTTRPVDANGLGFTTQQAAEEVGALGRLFLLLPEVPLQDAWERLVVDYRVSGKSAHDARLVASMVVHGVESILTFNTQDFLRYGEIRVLTVAAIRLNPTAANLLNIIACLREHEGVRLQVVA
jgi:predicted nucleic acid-binding protein